MSVAGTSCALSLSESWKEARTAEKLEAYARGWACRTRVLLSTRAHFEELVRELDGPGFEVQWRLQSVPCLPSLVVAATQNAEQEIERDTREEPAHREISEHQSASTNGIIENANAVTTCPTMSEREDGQEDDSVVVDEYIIEEEDSSEQCKHEGPLHSTVRGTSAVFEEEEEEDVDDEESESESGDTRAAESDDDGRDESDWISMSLDIDARQNSINAQEEETPYLEYKEEDTRYAEELVSIPSPPLPPAVPPVAFIRIPAHAPPDSTVQDDDWEQEPATGIPTTTTTLHGNITTSPSLSVSSSEDNESLRGSLGNPDVMCENEEDEDDEYSYEDNDNNEDEVDEVESLRDFLMSPSAQCSESEEHDNDDVADQRQRIEEEMQLTRALIALRMSQLCPSGHAPPPTL